MGIDRISATRLTQDEETHKQLKKIQELLEKILAELVLTRNK
jgi:hypothetical protein